MGGMERHGGRRAISETRRQAEALELQIYDMFVEWLVSTVATGPIGAGGEAIAGVLETGTGGERTMGTLWRRANLAYHHHLSWLGRKSEGQSHLGPSKDLGVRPVPYLIGGAYKRMLEHLPDAKQRRAKIWPEAIA